MRLSKYVSIGFVLSAMLFNSAYATQFSWRPNLRLINIKAGVYAEVSGSAQVDAYNDTSEPVSYTYMLGVNSDCGTLNHSGLYTRIVTLQPGERFSENRNVVAGIKCNYPGLRKVTLTVGFSDKRGSVYFQQQEGFITAV